ncbi:MAG: hypothetical protein AAGD96_04450 [Chloroflexota bacterium]
MYLITRPMGLLEVSGATRLDLINRMSTNQVALLKPGQGAATVLTTEMGRIIDRLILFADEDKAIMMTGESNGDNIGRYLMRFVFFNDDFALNPIHSTFSTLFVYGQDAQAKISEFFNTEVDLTLHHWQHVQFEGENIILAATDPLDVHGYVFIVPNESLEKLTNQLTASGGQSLSEEEFDAMRIEHMLPRLRYEMTGDYIPLETGLWDDISFTKGCYTGQEIIARMDSRNKVTKQLVQLDLDGPLPIGTDFLSGGIKAGTITTSAGNRALGYVKKKVLQGQAPITAGEVTIHPVYEAESE